MPHNHSSDIHTAHSHVHTFTSINRAFVFGIIVNLAYVIVQVIVGLKIKSLALLSDAGHNFLDVAGLALSMLAIKLSNSKETDQYTYGRKKASILISLLNASILLISIGAIGYEAFFRFQHPQPLPGVTIAIVSAVGILINAGSAFLFFKDRDKDMNIKAAFLHLASDAAVSLVLVAGALIMYYTKVYWIDPLLSIIVCAVIILATWSLLKNSLKLSLDGVPENVDIAGIIDTVKKVQHVKDFRHVHVWAISTTQTAMTAHLTLEQNLGMEQAQAIKERIKHELVHLNIHHCTIETEM